MSRLLAIDTTSGACSAALLDEHSGVMLAARYQLMMRGHAEALAPMVRDVMAKAGLSMPMITRIAVTTGPGTFTGCRIGLAFARTLGAALGRPVQGLTSLEAIAANVFLADEYMPGAAIAAVMDARRGEVYMQIFGPDGSARSEPQVLGVEDAAAQLADQTLVLTGTGADVLLGAARSGAANWSRSSEGDFPDARHVARLAAARPDTETMPEPLYLRAPDAKLPKNKPQLRAGQQDV